MRCSWRFVLCLRCKRVIMLPVLTWVHGSMAAQKVNAKEEDLKIVLLFYHMININPKVVHVVMRCFNWLRGLQNPFSAIILFCSVIYKKNK